jgi:hypothetical protein
MHKAVGDHCACCATTQNQKSLHVPLLSFDYFHRQIVEHFALRHTTHANGELPGHEARLRKICERPCAPAYFGQIVIEQKERQQDHELQQTAAVQKTPDIED